MTTLINLILISISILVVIDDNINEYNIVACYSKVSTMLDGVSGIMALLCGLGQNILRWGVIYQTELFWVQTY